MRGCEKEISFSYSCENETEASRLGKAEFHLSISSLKMLILLTDPLAFLLKLAVLRIR